MASNPFVLYGPQAPHTKGPRAPRPPRRPHAPPLRPPHAPTPPHVLDPLAPLTDAQLSARASADVHAQLDPILKQISDAINARSASGQSAIRGTTSALGSLFSQAAPATAAAFSEARGAQSAADNALADRLAGFGKNLAGEQNQQLASINAPAATGEMTGQTAQTGTGASNANFARGSAELGALTSHGANALAYDAKLPGIAGLTGLQNSRNLEAQLAHELADQTGKVQAEAPGLIQSILQHLRDNETQKAVYRQSGLLNDKKLAADQSYKNRTLAYQKQKELFSEEATLQRLGISRDQVIERARHDGITEAQAARRLAQQAAASRRAAAAARTRNRIAQQNANAHTYSAHHAGKGGKGKAPPWKKSGK
jgi:hypothetical protein